MALTLDKGFFDLQVNGYMGVDFNSDDLTAEQLHRACLDMRSHGVDGFLATITTDLPDKMAGRLSKIAAMRASDELVAQTLAGFHIEGPFINETPGYRGCHPVFAIEPASPDRMKRLLDDAAGLTRLVTLAPERDAGMQTTAMLVRAGVKVSAGHCNPTLDELLAAIDAGLSIFTHLGNGCPMQMHRSENIIQRALSLSEKLWLCFIADGAHVEFTALRNYIRAAGVDRCVVVTDAISAAGMSPGKYRFGVWDLVIGPDMVARAPDGSHLVGAAYTMPQAFRNLVDKVGLSEQDAHRLTADNPRTAIGAV